MITTNNITDEQIRELRDALRREQEELIEKIHVTTTALVSQNTTTRRDARMHCAKILNDRARMEKAQ